MHNQLQGLMCYTCCNRGYHILWGEIMSEPSDIGLKIKAIRQQNNMTQRKLGEAISVAGSTISNWETGSRQPSFSELRRMAALFGVPISYFDAEGIQETAQSDHQKQYMRTVLTGPAVKPIPRVSIGMQAAAILLLGLSLFTSDVLAVLSVVFGTVASFIALGIGFYLGSKSNTQRHAVNIPHTHHVAYRLVKQPTLSQTAVLVASFSGLFLHGALYLQILILAVDASLYGLMVSCSAFALLALTWSLLRYLVLSQSSVLQTEITYDHLHRDLRQRLLVALVKLDSLACLGIAWVFLIGRDLFSSPMRLIIVFATATLCLILSTIVTIQVKTHLRAMTLHVKAPSGTWHPLNAK